MTPGFKPFTIGQVLFEQIGQTVSNSVSSFLANLGGNAWQFNCQLSPQEIHLPLTLEQDFKKKADTKTKQQLHVHVAAVVVA